MSIFNANLQKETKLYVDKFCENAKLIEAEDCYNQSNSVSYDKLCETTIEGIPFSSRLVDDKLQVLFHASAHETIIGGTGSGKTTGIIDTSIRALSERVNKPHLVVADPKGECYNKHLAHLKKNGYNVKVLNFKNSARSDTWNPLCELYNKSVECREARDNGDDDLFIRLKSEAYDLIEGIVVMMIKVSEGSKDKSWEDGARQVLRGQLYALVDDVFRSELGVDENKFTIYTLSKMFNVIKKSTLDSNNLSFIKYFSCRGRDSDCCEEVSSVLESANVTTKGYLSTYRGLISNWYNSKVYSMTLKNTINIEDFDKGPVAVFIITRDYEEVDFVISGLFIDWLYRQLVQRADKNKSLSLDVPAHFYLDEFGNLPKIKMFGNKVSIARSRNIFFHIVLQSYSQLEGKYGEEATTILDNCNYRLFLGSPNHATKDAFSQECGVSAITSLEGVVTGNPSLLVERRLMPVSKLNCISEGEFYATVLNENVFHGSFARSYKCKQFMLDYNGLEQLPINLNSYTDQEFQYDFMKIAVAIEKGEKRKANQQRSATWAEKNKVSSRYEKLDQFFEDEKSEKQSDNFGDFDLFDDKDDDDDLLSKNFDINKDVDLFSKKIEEMESVDKKDGLPDTISANEFETRMRSLRMNLKAKKLISKLSKEYNNIYANYDDKSIKISNKIFKGGELAVRVIYDDGELLSLTDDGKILPDLKRELAKKTKKDDIDLDYFLKLHDVCLCSEQMIKLTDVDTVFEDFFSYVGCIICLINKVNNLF